MPLHLENDRGVEIGGARLGAGAPHDDDGILAIVRLNIVGDLPTEVSASELDLHGETSELNLDARPVPVGE